MFTRGNLRAGLCGITRCGELQIQENIYLRRLFSVPGSTSSFTIHKELGMSFVEDILRISPTLAWHDIWAKEGTKLRSNKKLSINGSLP